MAAGLATALALIALFPIGAQGRQILQGVAAIRPLQLASSYVVKTGDTLYGIAAQYGVATNDIPDWVDKVVKLNGLADANTLSVGANLQLPDASGQDASPSAIGNSSGGPTVPYTVQPGDTLSGIGSRLGVADSALKDWTANVVQINGLATADTITAGQVLQLPAGGSPNATAAPRPASNPGLGAVPPPVPYAVQPGDTLRGIGGKLGVAGVDLENWIANVVTLNSLASADQLVAGQQIQLPPVGASPNTTATPPPIQPAASPTPSAPQSPSVPYTIQAGDTIYSIGAKLGISGDALVGWVDQVLRLSGLASTALLHEGQVIQIPVSNDNAALVKAPASNGAPPAATTPYTVQAGDTLSSIADKQGIAGADVAGWISQVLDLNDLSDANMLTVGQHLLLPAPAPTPGGPAGTQTANGPDTATSETSCFYTVKAGDSWQSIAAKLGIADRNYQAWVALVSSMNGIDPTLLPVGDALRLPC